MNNIKFEADKESGQIIVKVNMSLDEVLVISRDLIKALNELMVE